MCSVRVLILANDCNPEWPSLPVVGYKYARSLANANEGSIVVTHIRNRENIEKAGELTGRVRYVDTEWIAKPMHRISVWLRRGTEVAWSIRQMMDYLPYLAFERQAIRMMRPELDRGDFDIVHRVTPMSPTMPSYAAGRTSTPFVLGPLNGSLDWPEAYRKEQHREKERLRSLRGVYHYLPFVRETYRKAGAILSSFDHTTADLRHADPARIVPMPEVGYDPAVFNTGDRTPPFSGPGPYQFLYAGRLVPYKLPEAVVRAFVASEALKPHVLRIVGSGPEEERMRTIVREAGAEDRVHFEGRKTQAEVAEAMRQADAFVFPSIRELGAGVVVEAMACGALLIVTDYGAPGALAKNGRGVRLALQPLDPLVEELQQAMERCLEQPEDHAELAEAGRAYAASLYDWDVKAAYTGRIYEAVLHGQSLKSLTDYDS